MRILHMITTIDPATGGTMEAVRALVQFAPEHVESEVVCLNDPAAPFLNSIPCPVHALGPTETVYARNRRLIPWLRQNRQRFDGVIVHGLWQFTGLAALRALAGRTRYVVFPHGMLDPYFKHAFPRKHLKKWPYWAAVEYSVLRRAARVLFTTQMEETLAQQSFWLHAWKAAITPLGAIEPESTAEQQSSAFAAAYPVFASRRFVLFLGRLHVKKGCDLLIEAFARVAGSDPELHLVMAGPDQQGWAAALAATAAQAGLAERVHFPGMIEGDAKGGARRTAEVFALPSHQENFGIAVAEALACGTPVLLADKVNIAPDVAADGAGLMETDTLAGTVRLLERWIALPEEERIAMSGRARQCFVQRYDMRHNTQHILELAGGVGE
jgi:glycosyltransferase involved in cell wall biosynthesis